jgi:TolB-like protein/Flp pilus assembly protein TadD
VLYELVAGRAPFDRPTPSEVIAAILDHDPPPLADYVREIPSELQRIISKALTKDRESRYQTAKDLLVDLRHLQRSWEAEKEVDWSSSAETRNTQAIGTRHQTIGKALNARYLLRAIIDHIHAFIIALVALALVVAAVIYHSYFTTGRQTIDSIAVLPLVNASNDPNTEYLSDGISESLINSLAELQHLRVIARPTAFRYKGKDVDPQALGRELDVRAVLMGRLRQIGDTLSIQVDLVDTATGAQLWGREYERKVSDLLSVKQLIAREVTGKLGLGLSGEQQQKLSKGDTTNPEAYQSYVRGLYFWKNRNDLRKAIEQFQQAIALDPNYALAYVGVANSYLVLEQYGGTPANETLPKARAAVERALAIDDSLAEAHTALGSIESRSWNFDESEKEYKRAIALNPNYPTAHHWYAVNLRDVRGRFDEALAEIKIAQRLDPLSPGIGAALAGTLAVNDEQDAAFQEAKKIIELDPTLPIGHWTLGILYRWIGRYEEAIAEGEKAVELSRRGSLYVSELGACYAAAGNRARALELLKEVEEKYKRREATGLLVAYVYVALGDKDQAFAWLEKDFQEQSGRLPQIAHFPMWENLRDDSRFQDLLRRMGLPQN